MSAVIVGTTAVGAIAAAIAIRACRDIIAAAASRGRGEGESRGGGGGYRGGNDVSVRGNLVSNAVTHPMAVLATGVANPFESRAGTAARRLSNWHRFIVGIAVSAVIVGTTAVGAIAAAIAIRACRDIIATAASRGRGEGESRGGGGGYRGGNDVSVRGKLVSNAVTHPMVVLATGAANPFESRRCPADPGHVALLPAPFTVGHRPVGQGRRFLLRPPSGVGTAVEWLPESKIRRQRFWRRTGLLLLLLAVKVIVASTARPGLLYSTSTSTRSTTAFPRSSITSTGGLEPSTSNKRVWVGRHPPCRPLFELTHLAVAQEARTICSTSRRRRKGESSRECFSIS